MRMGGNANIYVENNGNVNKCLAGMGIELKLMGMNGKAETNSRTAYI